MSDEIPTVTVGSIKTEQDGEDLFLLLHGVRVAKRGRPGTRNGAALEVVANDARLIRGRSALAVIGTEAAHWRTDEANSSSDAEVIAAAKPSMAMTPGGGLLILSSSPYRKSGVMFERWRELWGKDDTDDIIWRAPSLTMNPALDAEFIAQELADNPARNRSEYLCHRGDREGSSRNGEDGRNV